MRYSLILTLVRWREQPILKTRGKGEMDKWGNGNESRRVGTAHLSIGNQRTVGHAHPTVLKAES
jgi:hypothetical protein